MPQTSAQAAFQRSTAIVGVGETAYLRRSDREEWDLALEAVRAAEVRAAREDADR